MTSLFGSSRGARLALAFGLSLMFVCVTPRIAAAARGGVHPAPFATAAPVNWPSYNNDLGSQRFSSLTQITPQNVAGLHQVCATAISQTPTAWKTGPIMVGGTLYATTATMTIALNATTCAVRWTNTYAKPFAANAGNRGAAYANGQIFRGTIDGHMQAINATTGALTWDRSIIASGSSTAIDAAPIVWRGALYIGTASGDNGQAGEVLALDQINGKTLWQEQTVPNLGTPLAQTWGDAARIAGGATWTSFTLDDSSSALYVSTGNAGPDFDDRLRAGSNAYANSVVVFDAMTGALRAGYQLVPQDVHDWDMAATPLLAQSTSSAHSLIAFAAGKDGYVHAIDTVAQRELWKTAVTTISNATAPITVGGTRFCPGTAGGVLWNGPAFLPALNALYVNSVDWCTTVDLSATPQPYSPGHQWLGSTNGDGTNDPTRELGWISAIDAASGKVLWRRQSTMPQIAGITATASGLIFTGDLSGNVLALNASTGALLVKIATNHPIGGGVISYSVGGKQYVAVAAGIGFGWNATQTNPEIAIFSL